MKTIPFNIDLARSGTPVQTRDGRKVRIYAYDGGGEYSIHGAIFENGQWFKHVWHPDGIWSNYLHDDRSRDLVHPAPKPEYEIKSRFNLEPAYHGYDVSRDGQALCHCYGERDAERIVAALKEMDNK